MRPMRDAVTAPMRDAVAATDGEDAMNDGEDTVTDDRDWSPALSRSVTLRHDRVRGTDLLVMPERVVVLRGSAGAVLRLCDGERTLGAIVAELAERFPGASVATEVPKFLGRLREEGWMR
jgi:pyrroloquinoline quinone biosynthesis protein D